MLTRRTVFRWVVSIRRETFVGDTCARFKKQVLGSFLSLLLRINFKIVNDLCLAWKCNAHVVSSRTDNLDAFRCCSGYHRPKSPPRRRPKASRRAYSHHDPPTRRSQHGYDEMVEDEECSKMLKKVLSDILRRKSRDDQHTYSKHVSCLWRTVMFTPLWKLFQKWCRSHLLLSTVFIKETFLANVTNLKLAPGWAAMM